MSDDNYRSLVIDARDALRDVIYASECGDNVIVLNQAYGSLTRTLNSIDASECATPPKLPSAVHPSTEAKHQWKALSQHGRERATLEALGDRRMTVSELIDEIPSKINSDWANDLSLYYPDVYSVLKKLLEAGEIDRQPAEVVKGRRIWRYYRRTELSGPIAELAEQLANDS